MTHHVIYRLRSRETGLYITMSWPSNRPAPHILQGFKKHDATGWATEEEAYAVVDAVQWSGGAGRGYFVAERDEFDLPNSAA
jgi:hypothetical protein